MPRSPFLSSVEEYKSFFLRSGHARISSFVRARCNPKSVRRPTHLAGPSAVIDASLSFLLAASERQGIQVGTCRVSGDQNIQRTAFPLALVEDGVEESEEYSRPIL